NGERRLRGPLDVEGDLVRVDDDVAHADAVLLPEPLGEALAHSEERLVRAQAAARLQLQRDFLAFGGPRRDRAAVALSVHLEEALVRFLEERIQLGSRGLSVGGEEDARREV